MLLLLVGRLLIVIVENDRARHTSTDSLQDVGTMPRYDVVYNVRAIERRCIEVDVKVNISRYFFPTPSPLDLKR